MKRHVQETGIRKWFGDDLIELQNQPLKAIDEFFKPYASCVISGCEVSGSSINPGLIAFVWDSAGQKYAKVVPFPGATGVSVWPQYLYLQETAITREYQSGGVKNIAIDSKAAMTSNLPAFPYVRILATGPEKTFRDVIQTSSFRFVTDNQILNWNDKPTVLAFNTHVGDTTAHITAAERTSWNDKVASGTFNTHNGDNTRHITAAERISWNDKVAIGTFNALANKAWTTDNFNPGSYSDVNHTHSILYGNMAEIITAANNSFVDLRFSSPANDWARIRLQSGVFSFIDGTNDNALRDIKAGNISSNGCYVFHTGNLNRNDADFTVRTLFLNEPSVRSWNIQALGGRLKVWTGDGLGNIYINGYGVFSEGTLNRPDIDFTARDIMCKNLKAYSQSWAGVSSLEFGSTSILASISKPGSTADIAFSTMYNSALVERMRILANGYIGINKSDPAHMLDVNGEICATDLIIA
jgi:hypothetical protein